MTSVKPATQGFRGAILLVMFVTEATSCGNGRGEGQFSSVRNLASTVILKAKVYERLKPLVDLRN
jgi:hypothetical protein